MANKDSRSIYFCGRATARKRKQRQFEAEQSDGEKMTREDGEKMNALEKKVSCL